jgi:hypothetical protein
VAFSPAVGPDAIARDQLLELLTGGLRRFERYRFDKLLAVPPVELEDTPAARVEREFACYLIEQRGLSQSTLAQYLPVYLKVWLLRNGVARARGCATRWS